MAASYPASLKSFTNKTDNVDLVGAAHVNDLQNEVVAIETELGTDVAGSATDLKTRLARCMANNGALQQGTSFPGSPNDGDIFYRTDLDVGFIWNGTTWKSLSGATEKGTSFPTGSDLYQGLMFYRTDEDLLYIYSGSAWGVVGSVLSNLIFNFHQGAEYVASQVGLIDDDDTTPGNITEDKVWGTYNNPAAYEDLIFSKFYKLSSVSTVRVYMNSKSTNSNSAYYAQAQIDIGGETAVISGHTTSTAWEWTYADVDVSGLSDGTVYDVTISVKSSQNANMVFFKSFIAYGLTS